MVTDTPEPDELGEQIRNSLIRDASSIGNDSNDDGDSNDEAFLTALAKKFSRKLTKATVKSKEGESGASRTQMKEEEDVSELSSYARLALRARRALTPLRIKRMSRASSGSMVSNSSNGTGIGEGVPVSQIREEAFSKPLSVEEMLEDQAAMRNKFPNVPTFNGNPPWITAYRPELVELPPSK